MLDGLSLTLGAAGYRVITAPNGTVALQRLQDHRVDLIIADIAMPTLNGYQLFEQVRQNPALVGIPFLFLTARALDSDVRFGKAMGVDDYLLKPITPEDLLATVTGRLRRLADLGRLVAPTPEAAPAPAMPAPVPPPAPARPSDVVRVGELRVAPVQYRVWMGEDEIQLSPREFKILTALAQRPGEVVEPRELLEFSHGLSTDNVEAGLLLRPVIRSLRRRLGYPIGVTGCIENVRGIGYRLTPPGR
jgi:DNA-binding response OmpR family regulator